MNQDTFTPRFLDSLPRARAALALARELHRGQRRESDQAPFILHPLEVAALLHNTGHPEPVVAAGILHDSVENASVSIEDIEGRLGSDVAGLVAAMTEDESIEGFERRKAALRDQIAEAGPPAAALYAADKVTKARELRARLAMQPDLIGSEPKEQARLDHYRQSLAMLEENAPDHPLVRQLRFELEALAALPPGGVNTSEVRVREAR